MVEIVLNIVLLGQLREWISNVFLKVRVSYWIQSNMSWHDRGLLCIWKSKTNIKNLFFALSFKLWSSICNLQILESDPHTKNALSKSNPMLWEHKWKEKKNCSMILHTFKLKEEICAVCSSNMIYVPARNQIEMKFLLQILSKMLIIKRRL